MFFMLQSIHAQLLLENSKQTLVLKNGVKLNCYKSHSTNVNTNDSYYYLPTNIHFSITKTGDKSYSLIVYKDNNREIKGGIMHWLVTWGLTNKQKEEAQLLLKSKVGGKAKLMGAVLSEKDNSKQDFEIRGTNELSKVLNRSMVNRGNVPLIPNSKIAIAFKFSKEDAQNIDDFFVNYNEKKATQISMQFVVSFKKSNGIIYKKNISIQQNLQNCLAKNKP